MFNLTSKPSEFRKSTEFTDNASTLAPSLAPSTTSTLSTLSSKLKFWKSFPPYPQSEELKERVKTSTPAEPASEKKVGPESTAEGRAKKELSPEDVEEGRRLARLYDAKHASGPGTAKTVCSNPHTWAGSYGATSSAAAMFGGF